MNGRNESETYTIVTVKEKSAGMCVYLCHRSETHTIVTIKIQRESLYVCVCDKRGKTGIV